MSQLDRSLNGPHSAPLRQWLAALAPQAIQKLEASGHGDYPRWRDALQLLPDLPVSQIDLTAGAVCCKSDCALDRTSMRQLHGALMQLSPWRKGPFDLFGVLIDSEWRSDRKWQRVQPHLHPLQGRTVLDVGCGNGYYAMRMCGAGAASVIGLDPSLLFNLQFHAVNRYLQQHNAVVLPLAGEVLTHHPFAFDTVFSMGVLYHRRDPLSHLQILSDCLRPGGQLVLETLVIEDSSVRFVKGQRYANMRNVWYLERSDILLELIAESGFVDIKCVDFHETDSSEQRQTEWMTFHSLAQALDPADPARTIEGLPSPCRAIVTAVKPNRRQLEQ